MSAKFQNKYRIDSTRLQNWNYSSNGKYFITICTCEMEHFFGKVANEKMLQNKIGELANRYWHEIPNHFPYVHLDEFIVMPNHIHGILVIDDPYYRDSSDDINVQTRHCLVSNQSKQNPGRKRFQNQGNNTISSIIGSYKSIVSKDAHKINPKFEWHTHFYDHIIKDQKALQRIRNYIKYNPKNWKEDKYFEW
ncbi:transposase [Marinifilum flexuosum]|uniref:transposase n=1 Tax=Marinifilum flexuosum TaxID=1117708 RepID=UPI00249584EF|nr:transposase [Marinifilum flexuosum]